MSAEIDTPLFKLIAEYLSTTYPGVVYHFNLPSSLASEDHPSLFVAVAAFTPGDGDQTVFHGLFLQIHSSGTALTTHNGRWATPELEEESLALTNLQAQGYVAQHVCGFEQAKLYIDSYMEGTPQAISIEDRHDGA